MERYECGIDLLISISTRCQKADNCIIQNVKIIPLNLVLGCFRPKCSMGVVTDRSTLVFINIVKKLNGTYVITPLNSHLNVFPGKLRKRSDSSA